MSDAARLGGSGVRHSWWGDGVGAASRWSVLRVLAVVWLSALSGSAVAGHDSYRAGSVILHDEAGASDGVVVVFPPDADPAQARAEVQRFAAGGGLELSDVSVQDNTDPDTLRVSAETPLGVRTGFLQRRVPAERIEGWQELAADGRLHLQVDDWARGVPGAPDGSGGFRVNGERDVDYAISVWALLVPLLVLLAATGVPYLLIRAVAARAERTGATADEKLHRVQRASTAVQLIAPIAVVVVLLGSGTGGWTQLVLSEVAPTTGVPAPAGMLLAVLGFLLPVLLTFAAVAAAVVPFDRRWRSTEQTVRAGTGQAMRGLALGLLPMLFWFTLLAFLPQISGWALVPLVLAFVLGMAALAPLLTNVVLTTRPLHEPRRSGVLDRCRQHGLSVRDVRVLDSRGGKVANAAISGVLPNLRYLYLTDHLLELLDDGELDAVLAHEIGHGKGHHLLIKTGVGLLVVAATVGVIALALPTLLQNLPDTAAIITAAVATPVGLVTALLLAHGVVGVALEKRADDHAARTSSPKPLITALEKIADANKTKRRTGWLWNVLQQHPGLEQRLQRLQAHDAPGRTASTG